MVKISFDPLVTETAQRLYGLSALIELIYRATPDVELQERDALKQLAERDGWEYGDYNVEDQFLDIKFREELPKLSAYSVIILLSSIVESQLLAYARRVGRQRNSAFDPNDLKGSVLERTTQYVKKISGSDLTMDQRWKTLDDLQHLRNIIVHRAGKPDLDKDHQVPRICKTYPGISLADNPYSISRNLELRVSIHSCRYFTGEVEEFFKALFKKDGLSLNALWPNIQGGFS